MLPGSYPNIAQQIPPKFLQFQVKNYISVGAKKQVTGFDVYKNAKPT